LAEDRDDDAVTRAESEDDRFEAAADRLASGVERDVARDEE
jgi:hypothetical protein